MRSTFRYLLSALLILVGSVTIQLQAHTMYVATNGSNSNPGTPDQPWHTISYATSAASGVMAGDTIIIREGNYPENVFPEISGTPEQHIVLRRMKNEVVTLNPGQIRFNTGADYWKVWGLEVTHSGNSGFNVSGTHPTNSFVFQKCTSSYNRYDGMYLSSAFGGVTILDCRFEFNGEVDGVPQADEGHGIVIYGGGPGKLVVKRSLIANNWHKGIAFGSAVQFQGDGSEVDSNIIMNNYESGCDFSPDNSFFRFNYVSRNGLRDVESGEFGDKGFMTTTYASNSTIAYNILKSNGGNQLCPLGTGNYYYNNVLYKDVPYTVVTGSPYQAAITFYDNIPAGSVFRNNIICNILSIANHHWAVIAEDYTSYTGQTWSNNLYWCPNAVSPSTKPFKLYNAPGSTYKTLEEVQTTWPGEETNSIYVDPGFVSGPDSNFTLVPNSPAIDAGADVGYRYFGQAPDIGAFEATSSDDRNAANTLFASAGAVTGLMGVGADEADFTVNPATDKISVNYGNGAVVGTAMPGMITLEQNSPNPFNPTSTIRFNLPNADHVKLTVYSMTGQLLKTLIQGQQSAGSHEVIFDGTGLASGVYLYRLETSVFSQTMKMILTK